MGHVSFHQDGTCHVKLRTLPGSTSRRGLTVVERWQLPAPLPGTRTIRLLDIHIPHRGLVVPEYVAPSETETILIPPPPAGHDLAVTLLLEPGTADQSSWPGKRSMGTSLVARAAIATLDDVPVFFVTAVALHQTPESAWAVRAAGARVEEHGVLNTSGNVRALVFAMDELDGAQVPVLTEMPIGHEYDGPRDKPDGEDQR